MQYISGSAIGSTTGRNYRAFLQPHDRCVRGKKLWFAIWKGHFCTQDKKPGELSPPVHSTAMYIRLENKSSDGLFQRCFGEWKKSLLYVSGNDICKLKPRQKMNEIVKPNMEASIFIKKSIMTGFPRKSILQLMQLSNSGKSIWKVSDRMETKYWRGENKKFNKQLARMINNCLRPDI